MTQAARIAPLRISMMRSFIGDEEGDECGDEEHLG
jgi:hypothetical protein